MTRHANAPKPLTLGEAVLPILVMVILFGAGVAAYGVSTELLIVIMLTSAAVAGVIAVRRGHTWDQIQRSTGDKLAAVLPAILILLTIGMLIGTWVLSGTIPFLVYWGVQLVSPNYLALTAFLATAVMSLATGTSWGSAGTIGVALMGTAAAVGAPMGATAGAVVSGAYFGDKLSPLSDSTNIAAIGAGAPLYAHVRHMLYTAVPSFIMGLLVFGLVARSGTDITSGVPDSARLLLGDIRNVYSLHWSVLLPPLIVIASIIKRIPPALAMTGASVLAALIGIIVQGFGLHDAITAAVAGFDTSMLDAASLDPTELSPAFGTLVERGGLYSMANTLIVVLAAFLLAGTMDASGSLDLMINRMLAAVRSVFGLIAATMASGATMIALTSHGGVTSLVVGELFQKAYAERELAPENLSRSLEDSVTIVEPLMPWTVSAVFMATTLGVPTTTYAPWAVFCYGGPIFSLLLAATYRRTGFGLRRKQADSRTAGQADS